MRRQPIFVCPKLLLGTWFLSLTPKADPILDDKAMNLSLISVCPWRRGRPGNPPWRAPGYHYRPRSTSPTWPLSLTINSFPFMVPILESKATLSP